MNEEKWQELISPDMVEYSMRMKNIIFKKHSNAPRDMVSRGRFFLVALKIAS
jgi:hypothetical protein